MQLNFSQSLVFRNFWKHMCWMAFYKKILVNCKQDIFSILLSSLIRYLVSYNGSFYPHSFPFISQLLHNTFFCLFSHDSPSLIISLTSMPRMTVRSGFGCSSMIWQWKICSDVLVPLRSYDVSSSRRLNLCRYYGYSSCSKKKYIDHWNGWVSTFLFCFLLNWSIPSAILGLRVGLFLTWYSGSSVVLPSWTVASVWLPRGGVVLFWLRHLVDVCYSHQKFSSDAIVSVFRIVLLMYSVYLLSTIIWYSCHFKLSLY